MTTLSITVDGVELEYEIVPPATVDDTIDDLVTLYAGHSIVINGTIPDVGTPDTVGAATGGFVGTSAGAGRSNMQLGRRNNSQSSQRINR